MKTKIRICSVLVFIFISLIFATSSKGMSNEREDREDAPALVGRISHVEGTLFGYDAEQSQWYGKTEDSPFGFNDRLKTEQHSKAEILLPNNTWIRLGQETGIELFSLEDQETSVGLDYGKARFINRGSNSRITVATPAGQVSAPAMSALDISVEEASVHILPLSGSAFLTRINGSTLEIRPGANGILVDGETIVAGREGTDPAWNDWNIKRDSLWAGRIQSGARSAEYLPPPLRDQAHVLQENGIWERVYYEGEYGYFWRPIHVPPGWSPFSVGRWTLWYGDHVWIPAEPFGYVTHHYGSWVFAHGRWYWVPPLPSASIAFGHPRWRIGFAWYPGRVAWIHSHLHVGWLPLAPYEPYYTHRHWGPRSVAVKNVHITGIHVQRYANIDHAVVVAREDLYRHDNYRNHRTTNPKSRRESGFSGRNQRPEQQVNPLGTPVNRQISPADRGTPRRISDKGSHRERYFRREDGEKPHGSVGRERSEVSNGHRFAPVPRNNNIESGGNRGRETFRQERVQPRAYERRSESLHPSERRQSLPNQVKKDRAANQERQELKRSEKGDRGQGPRA
ncbi:MAG: hypothetical protein C4576_30250 [Desulfobacteraceae bacterium]|nr:MAG: hypothetical protein C4576_30250 [Desulfobacteraceae bacterium]